MRRATPTLAAGLVLAAALAAPPVRADWLVTRDGARVETKGAWEVKGKLVIFTTAAGDLASLRVAEVDLEASRAATAEAKTAAAAAPEKRAPEKRKAVRVLTDKDFPRRAAPAPPPAAAPEKAPATGGEAEAAAAEEPAASPLVVSAWERQADASDEHVVISGALRNGGSETVTGATLLVRLYDETGQVVGTAQAALTTTAIPAGEAASFRADFPGIFAFAAVKFEATSMRLRRSPEPTAPSPPGDR